VIRMRWIWKNRREVAQKPESAEVGRASRISMTRSIEQPRSIEEICNSFEAPAEFDTEEVLGR
jgi:hypothetical protein